jgi:chromosome partitioning protein
MTKVISIINLKGGVGKTSLTIALGEFLADENKKNVLIIDIDPQTNATVSLIDQDRWQRLDQEGKTIAQLFEDKLSGQYTFNLEQSIVRGVSNVHGGIINLSLLPSSLRLIDMQDRLSQIPSLTYYRNNPVEVLQLATSNIISDNQFDYILIDCPPNLGLITQNALKISTHYLIPVVPDIVSTLGIPQISKNVDRFSDNWGISIDCLGMVLTKVKQVNLHRSTEDLLRQKAENGEYPRVWESTIKDTVKGQEAFNFESSPSTLKGKYGSSGLYQQYKDVKEEFLRLCPA